MSSKINIKEIIKGHFSTLRKDNGDVSISDYFTFYLLPISTAIITLYLEGNISKEVSSLLVNFGSIFTALLLSVLVLVYDQEAKLNNNKKPTDKLFDKKKDLLDNLYDNISFSILSSVFLVLLCLFHTAVFGKYWGIDFTISTLNFKFDMKFDHYLSTPLILIISLTVFMNILMIVKRMHILLTTDRNRT